MNDTPVQLGAKFLRSGFGLFIFGFVMSFGVVRVTHPLAVVQAVEESL